MGDDAREAVLVEERGPLLMIGLNRPEKRNAADRAMLTGLAAALTRLESDEALRVGLIWAVGEHFTAGLDLTDPDGPLATGADAFLGGDLVDPWQLRGPARTKPLVVAVQGTCLTLGVELVLAADIAVAADTAVFGQIEVSRGILPFGGATIRFPRVSGWGNAMRWLLTGERFDAREAYRIGLVQEVVPAGTERSAAQRIAERIAEQAPLAVAATLANARLATAEGPDAAAAALPRELARLAASKDAAEGMRSFAERRDPVFRGD
jgi:enoyl-CoA hydratase/carnithine racemase